MRNCPRCQNTAVIEDGYCGHCRECTMQSLDHLHHGPTARRADALQLERMARMINEAMPGFTSAMGSECDHAEIALVALLKAHKRNADFVRVFLNTFEGWFSESYAKNRVVEFVRALTDKEVA